MAESVDALVSNTSGATRAGSTPALGTLKAKYLIIHLLSFFSFLSEVVGQQQQRCGDMFIMHSAYK